MGFLDEIGAVAGQLSQNSDQAKVAGGLMQALEQHPGGIQGLIDNFKQNGLGDHVNALASGEQQTTTPEQVEQGLSGTGLIEQAAEKAGVSPDVVKTAMSTVLPMVIQHFAPNGQVAGQSEFGGMAQQLLSRFL
ncbi:YidB family protein [Granulicella arctica]|uniref:Uncharacterized protein YidB (DUF937 family) n=1 Tax=Granulicella arctica TaxID=940613 RepID=A0A7Y9PGT7_9BACT|nr:YidB family protein [Granulicella arctica]NYF78906.1 uncharacterized protein YidB (DUF937 family) [Granulicella arctica]